MTEPKFTPGPWTALIQGKDSAYIDVIDKNGRFICGCFENIPREEEPIANATLIAAAPDMYKELQFFCKICDAHICALCGIGKVLRKASGESEVSDV